MKQGNQPGADASEAAATATAVASAAASTHSPKAISRRKKVAQTCGSSEWGGEGKPRSASASITVPNYPVKLFQNSQENGLSNSASEMAGEAAINGGLVVVTEDRPPWSSARKPKACVPTLEDALDDVQVRFVLNLPEAELSSADRLFFQLEQAWWFYEDFIADAHKHLPHFRLKEFAKLMFEHCEALRPLSGKYYELFELFKSWKGTIPTAGCILLNPEMTKVVLVKSWKGNSRGLPKGKINQGESAIAAAVREVKEETGFDASVKANERDFLSLYLNGQQTTMYIATGVDEGFPFEPQVRKEISAVEWFPLDALPKGCYGVEPFVPRLRRWMLKAKGVRAPKGATADARTQSLVRIRKGRATSQDISSVAAAASAPGAGQPSSPACAGTTSGMALPKKQGRKGGKGKAEAGRACSAPSRRNHVKGCDANNRDTFGSGGLDHANGGEGWDFEAMLAANERLTGRTFLYDGNPHEFGEPAQMAALAASPVTVKRAPATPVGPAHGNLLEELGGVHRKECGGQTQDYSRSEEVPADSSRRAGILEPADGVDDGISGGCEDKMENKAWGGQKCAEDVHERVGISGRGRNFVRDTAAGISVTANARENYEKEVRLPQGTSERVIEGGQDSGGGDARGTEGRTRPRAVAGSSPCTEGVGRKGHATALESSSGESTAAGGAGFFGEFKFDLMDIMSAVSRG